MKKLMTSALALGLATGAAAADEVTLQLQWVTQAQFAGYYVALENGYYEEEGLDVTIQFLHCLTSECWISVVVIVPSVVTGARR